MTGNTFSLGAATPNETTQYAYSGTLIEYIGKAKSLLPSQVVAVSAISAAAAASFSATAHGLVTGQTVTISLGSGDWAGLNGTRVVTVTSANAFTVAVNSSAYTGTFTGMVTTTVPQTSNAVWQIQKFVYDGSDQLTQSYWADGTAEYTKAWDSRATYSYQ